MFLVAPQRCLSKFQKKIFPQKFDKKQPTASSTALGWKKSSLLRTQLIGTLPESRLGLSLWVIKYHRCLLHKRASFIIDPILVIPKKKNVSQIPGNENDFVFHDSLDVNMWGRKSNSLTAFKSGTFVIIDES